MVARANQTKPTKPTPRRGRGRQSPQPKMQRKWPEIRVHSDCPTIFTPGGTGGQLQPISVTCGHQIPALPPKYSPPYVWERVRRRLSVQFVMRVSHKMRSESTKRQVSDANSIAIRRLCTAFRHPAGPDLKYQAIPLGNRILP